MRWLAVAALGAAFLTLPAWGQRRGGASGGFAGHAGFSGGHAMVGGRGSMMSSRGYAGSQRSGVRIVTTYSRSGYGHGRGWGYYRRWPYAGYYGYPYYGYGWWGSGDDSSYLDSSQSYPPPDDSAAAADVERQQAAIDRLENEVDRLRQEREARESQASPARTKTDLEPTELVFRDKHTEQVRNYAIVGQTFWILNAERARKIPIAQLDIPATQKANRDRGVDFELPE